jgi:hypothetical protein
MADLSTPSTFCRDCGARVLTECEACETPIPGLPVGVGGKYRPPDFCLECGTPYPWLSRRGRIYLLENMLDDAELDPATELEARELLEALTAADLEDAEQLERWRRFKSLVPQVWEKSGAQRILESVVSATIKGALGL